MITKQYIDLTKLFFTGQNAEVKDAGGTIRTVSRPTSIGDVWATQYFVNILQNNNSNAGVRFGNGDKDVTYEDYNLDGAYISNLQMTANVDFKNDDNNNLIITCVYTLTNSTSEDITIKEIGYFARLEYNLYLLDRTLLSSPMTIEANGGVGQLTYAITVKFPVLGE